MALDLSTHFPEVDFPLLAMAAEHYAALFPDLPLEEWTRTGSFMSWWNNGVRIAFAPRKQYASIHFQGEEGVELYRVMGGTCPVGRVTINLPYGEAIDAERIRHVIATVISSGQRKRQ